MIIYGWGKLHKVSWLVSLKNGVLELLDRYDLRY